MTMGLDSLTRHHRNLYHIFWKATASRQSAYLPLKTMRLIRCYESKITKSKAQEKCRLIVLINEGGQATKKTWTKISSGL
jgi:hypothetical protein